MNHRCRPIFYSIIVIPNHDIKTLAADFMIELSSFMPIDIEFMRVYFVSFILFTDEVVHGNLVN